MERTHPNPMKQETKTGELNLNKFTNAKLENEREKMRKREQHL